MFDPAKVLESKTVQWFASLTHIDRCKIEDHDLDIPLQMLSSELALNGLPVRLGGSSFDARFPEPDRLYRGLSKPQYLESYIQGEYRASRGIFGSGIYACSSKIPNLGRKTAQGFGANVLTLGFSHTARIASLRELTAQMKDIDSELDKYLFEAVSRIEGPRRQKKIATLVDLHKAAKRLMGSEGFFSMVTGVDAYYVHFDEMKGREVDYYIIVNREATIVRID